MIEITEERIKLGKEASEYYTIRRIDEILGYEEEDWERLRKEKEAEMNKDLDSDGNLPSFPDYLGPAEMKEYLEDIKNKPYSQIDWKSGLTDFQTSYVIGKFLLSLGKDKN